MKLLGMILFGILAAGCSTKHYYMLSSPHAIETQKAIETTVGVESVALPDYLQAGKIAVLHDDQSVTFLDGAFWAVDMQKDLTNGLIFDLQKSFPKSRIYHYPWEGTGQPAHLLSLKIKRFIAHGQEVYLDAVVRLDNRDRVISIREPIEKRDAAGIVAGMKRAFFRLEHAVADLLDDMI